jgi:hypothetical protein
MVCGSKKYARENPYSEMNRHHDNYINLGVQCKSIVFIDIHCLLDSIRRDVRPSPEMRDNVSKDHFKYMENQGYLFEIKKKKKG